MPHTNCQIEALAKIDFNRVVSKPYILYTIIYCINLAVEKKNLYTVSTAPRILNDIRAMLLPLTKTKEKIAQKKKNPV